MKLIVDEDRGTAILPLPGAECLPELLEYRGERFVRKSELHVTVAGSRDRRAPAALREAARGLDFKVRPSGVRRLVRKGEKRSLIELVAVSGLDEYCSRLGTPLPPSHVTLFTEPGGGGIALYSAADLAALSVEADFTLAGSPWRLDGDGAILGA